ncbi:monocarboxylate transporter 13-like isoform X1 [Crassostrea virginica]
MVASREKTEEILRKRYYQTKRRYVVFVGCVLIQFLVVGMVSTMLGIVYVDITREFRTNASQAALMLSLFRGISFGGGVLGEFVIRRVGEFPCMMGGSLVGSVTILASAFAQNMVTIVLLIGVGTGCSCIFPILLSYVYISKAFPPESVSRYLTIMTMGAGIGFVTTPYITEALLSGFGWRGTLLISSGIFFHLVLIGIVIQFNLPPRSSHDSQKSNGHSWKDPIVIFKNRSYVTFILCMALFGMFGPVGLWFLPDFLVSNNHTMKDAALVLTLSGIANLIGRVFAGVFESCFSRTKLLYHWIYIFIMLALSHASFPFFTELYPVLCTSGAVYGLSFGLIVSQSVPVIVQVLNQKLVSMGTAIEFTIYGLCSVLGGYICGMIRDVTGGYKWVFYIASMSAAICSAFCITLFIVDKSCQRKISKNGHINTVSIITHF